MKRFRFMKIVLALVMPLAASMASAELLLVNHTPYLQLGNATLGTATDRVDIMWQTVPAGAGMNDTFTVEYRQVGSTTWNTAGAVSTLDTGVEGRVNHTATVTGLQYNTSYEYRVLHERDGSPVATYQNTFDTRLAPGDNTAFTFAAYGDSANYRPEVPGAPANAGDFEILQDRINQTNAAFALSLGDNAYSDGTHPQYDGRLDPAINPAATAWNSSHIDYLAYGNHDVQTVVGRPTVENYAVPHNGPSYPSSITDLFGDLTEHDYAFEYGDALFVTFNTNSRFISTDFIDVQLDWVVDQLEASDARWKIVYGHHHMAGTDHDNEGPADYFFQQIVDRLGGAGADLFLSGHSHEYLWTYPLTGVTDDVAEFVLDTDRDYAKGAGLVHLISGVGGKGNRDSKVPYASLVFVSSGFSNTDSTSDNPLVSPGQRSEIGFTQVDVAHNRLTLSYINANDGSVIDSFTITSPPVSEPSTLTLPALFTLPALLTLLGIGAIGLLGYGWRLNRRKRRAA